MSSAFIEPDAEQIRASAECGFDAVELWTGEYAHAKPGRAVEKAIERLMAARDLGRSAGLVVHAGHGLTYRNIGPIAGLRAFEEFNIGHSIVARAVLVGLREAVREMKRRLEVGSTD